MASTEETEPPGLAVSVRELRLDGPRGTVYRDVEFDAGPGTLLVLDGASGSGRTCLLLTLTGRMRPGAGHAEVGGHRLPRHAGRVRTLSALGPVPGVNDLDPSLSVAEHLRERVLVQRRFGGPLRSLLRSRHARREAARERMRTALGAAGLDLDTLPRGPRTRVHDLERLEAFRLGVALALIGRPRLLAVDDVGLKLSHTEHAAAWALLRSLAAAGTTVLAVGAPPPGSVGGPDDVPVVHVGPRGEATTDGAGDTGGTPAPSDGVPRPAGDNADGGAPGGHDGDERPGTPAAGAEHDGHGQGAGGLENDEGPGGTDGDAAGAPRDAADPAEKTGRDHHCEQDTAPAGGAAHRGRKEKA